MNTWCRSKIFYGWYLWILVFYVYGWCKWNSMVTVWRFKSPSPSKMFINLILCWQDMSCFDLKQMSRDFSPHAGYGAKIFSFDLIIISYRYGIEQASALLNIYKTSKKWSSLELEYWFVK